MSPLLTGARRRARLLRDGVPQPHVGPPWSSTLQPRPKRSRGELLKLVDQAEDFFGGNVDPLVLLAWARDTFGLRLAVSTSGADGVLAHLAGRVAPGVDLLFVDTGYHFAETIGTADTIQMHSNTRLIPIAPVQSRTAWETRQGPTPFLVDADACCATRKVAPLNTALGHYDAWATGLRRVDHIARANTPLVHFDDKRGVVKLNPLAAWNDDDVERYIAFWDVPTNPLLAEGYTSIGCAPCTLRPTSGDARSGRWAGTNKVECGMHV